MTAVGFNATKTPRAAAKLSARRQHVPARCFEACDCAVGPLDPIIGTFALVPTTPLFREFAVVNVRWLGRLRKSHAQGADSALHFHRRFCRSRTDARRFTNPVSPVRLRSLSCGKTLLLSGFFRNA